MINRWPRSGSGRGSQRKSGPGAPLALSATTTHGTPAVSQSPERVSSERTQILESKVIDQLAEELQLRKREPTYECDLGAGIEEPSEAALGVRRCFESQHALPDTGIAEDDHYARM